MFKDCVLKEVGDSVLFGVKNEFFIQNKKSSKSSVVIFAQNLMKSELYRDDDVVRNEIKDSFTDYRYRYMAE